MKVIKRLFNNSPYIPADQLAAEYVNQIRLNSSDQLPAQYQSSLSMSLLKCQNPNQFLRQLMKIFKQMSNHTAMIKFLTVIHHFAIERQYFRDDIQELEEFQMSTINEREDEKWFIDFTRSYITYLMKLPALSDVYINIESKQYNVPPAVHLVHIFRITNTVRVLFPAVTNAVNVVGRYQATKHLAMRELFVVVSGELVKLYSYIRYLCDQILRQYRVYNPKDLKCFLQSLPELQLLCDKIQDLLVNKYLKGRKIVAKIQFKQQRVAQVQYYLDYECISERQKNKTETLLSNVEKQSN